MQKVEIAPYGGAITCTGVDELIVEPLPSGVEQKSDPKFACYFGPCLRFSSVEYSRYSPSSCLNRNQNCYATYRADF